MSRPRTTEDDVVLVVKEVRAIGGIELHGLVALMLRQCCASPFPEATHVAQAGESISILSDWHGMPIVEAHIHVREIDVELVGVWMMLRCIGEAVD